MPKSIKPDARRAPALLAGLALALLAPGPETPVPAEARDAPQKAAEKPAAERIGQSHGWSVWREPARAPGARKACYLLAEPENAKNPRENTQKAAALVLLEPEPMVGFLLERELPGSRPLRVQIAARTFALKARADAAWLEEKNENARLVQAMKQGRTLATRVPSETGPGANAPTRQNPEEREQYSLRGFTAAYRLAERACAKKRNP